MPPEPDMRTQIAALKLAVTCKQTNYKNLQVHSSISLGVYLIIEVVHIPSLQAMPYR